MINLKKIIVNELKTIFTDPGSLLIMVIGAFLYSLFYTIPFSTDILKDVPIGVIDYDNSTLSRELTRNLDSHQFIKIVEKPLDFNEAQTLYYKDKIKSFIIIPKDFQKNIYRGGFSTITSYEDGAYLIIYKQIATGILTTTNALGAKLEIGSFMKKGVSKQQAINIKLPFDFVDIPLFNPIGSYQNYIYPIVLVLILQQTLLVGAGLLAATLRERLNGYKKWSENGIVEMKLEHINPYSDNPLEVVLGKSIAYTSLYFIYALIYFLVMPAFVTYNMTYNIIPMVLMLLPFLFATSCLAQALMYFYTERENSLLLLVVTSVPILFLPGFVWPKECIPMWLTIISKFIPSTSAMDGLTRINQMGASFWQVQHDFYMLVVLCVLYFYLAYIVTKNLVKTR